MTEGLDTFGMALLEALDGRDGRHPIERDDGREDWFQASPHFDTAGSWPPATVQALSELHGRVLDVGCGAGRHALHLAASGCEVLGVDPSPGAVEVCRRRGVNAVVGSLGDSSLLADQRFDAIVLLGNNLGLLASLREAPGASAGSLTAADPVGG